MHENQKIYQGSVTLLSRQSYDQQLILLFLRIFVLLLIQEALYVMEEWAFGREVHS